MESCTQYTVHYIELHSLFYKPDFMWQKTMYKYFVLFTRLNDSLNYYDTQHRTVFLYRQAVARYRALASIILACEKFSWNLSF